MKQLSFILILIFPFLSFCAQATTLDEIQSLVHSLEKKYALKFYYTQFPKDYDDLDYEFATKEDYTDLYNYLKLFETEFDKYPTSFIGKINIKSIGIVKSLAMANMFRSRPAGGVEKAEDDRFIVDFKSGNYNADYQRGIIHHEFFHLIDKQIHNGIFNKDPVWKKLNTSLDFYTTASWYVGGTYAGVLNNPDPGFINLYSESQVEEDKAEIFATLFVSEDYSKVMEWEDEIILKKMDYIKNTLNKIDAVFNQEYWEKMHNKVWHISP